MDALDRRILIELQKDGSLTNAHLAELVGLSQSAMSERVRRLESDGHITGYRALVSPASLGIGPKSVKKCADLAAVSTAALGEYVSDVRCGAFPEEDHCYRHFGGEQERFVACMEETR
jgi:DNA-binding Lrp family transcriptional regulator